ERFPTYDTVQRAHVRKLTKPNEPESSSAAVLAAIAALLARFSKQEKKMEDLGKQMTQNCILIGSLTKAMEFNAVEVKECKQKVSTLEKQVSTLRTEVDELKERSREQDRYKRRWNLRVNGMREKMNENIREDVIQLLGRVAPEWSQKMDEYVDPVHRLGRKEEKQTHQVIIQFIKHQHRDGIWKITKESQVCKEAGIRFTEDLTRDDKLTREALWPCIQQARNAGGKAYFHGPVGFINGRRICAKE
ncbi:hypothetical protein HHUSO_G4617, partial [Huso huso]